MDPALAGARCAAHPDRGARGACSRCGAFVCDGCARTYDYKLLCEACFGRLPHVAPTSSRAVWAIRLGAASLLCFPVGPIAVIAGAIELSKIRHGESPPGGRGMAIGAIVFGATGTATSILVVGVLLLYGALRGGGN